MIPGQWYAVLESHEVKPGKPIGVTRMGEKMVFWRDRQGKVNALADLCPHRGAALSIGKLQGDCIECPFHGFRYDQNGRCTTIPAIGKEAEIPKAFQVRAFPTQEAHGFIYLWWGSKEPVYAPPPFFDSIEEGRFSSHTVRAHWKTHYSRAIENQLDVIHLPFVHKTTIGRGDRTLVNGPLGLWDEHDPDLLNIWVYNQKDQGQRPLRPDELPAPERSPFLQFHFPNVWQNWISDGVRIVVAFVPIDDENTTMYVRMYQRVVRIPGLKQLFNWMSAIGNRLILQQDQRVVETQLPKSSHLHMGEKLIQGDRPIIEYRQHRQILMNATNKSTSEQPAKIHNLSNQAHPEAFEELPTG